MLPIPFGRLAGIAFTSLALATTACVGDDDDSSTGPTDPPADVSGTYELTGLRTLGNLGGGGSGLPVTFVDGGGSTLTFTSGQLVLSSDGTYTLAVEAQFNETEVTLEK